MIAIGYGRVSTDDQADNGGLRRAVQRHVGDEDCKSEGEYEELQIAERLFLHHHIQQQDAAEYEDRPEMKSDPESQ